MADTRKRRRLLYRLMGGWTGYCTWCSIPIVIRQDVEEMFTVIRASHCRITYLRDGQEITARLATIDHIIPRSEGGTNQPENLAPACADCNCHRQNVAPTSNKPCRRCGGPRDRRRVRHCSACRAFFASQAHLYKGVSRV